MQRCRARTWTCTRDTVHTHHPLNPNCTTHRSFLLQLTPTASLIYQIGSGSSQNLSESDKCATIESSCRVAAIVPSVRTEGESSAQRLKSPSSCCLYQGWIRGEPPPCAELQILRLPKGETPRPDAPSHLEQNCPSPSTTAFASVLRNFSSVCPVPLFIIGGCPPATDSWTRPRLPTPSQGCQ